MCSTSTWSGPSTCGVSAASRVALDSTRSQASSPYSFDIDRAVVMPLAAGHSARYISVLLNSSTPASTGGFVNTSNVSDSGSRILAAIACVFGSFSSDGGSRLMSIANSLATRAWSSGGRPM